jgi:hypothetical protein
MIPMLTTSLHLEIARLRRENERLQEQRDVLLSQHIASSATGDTAGMQPTVMRVFMTTITNSASRRRVPGVSEQQCAETAYGKHRARHRRAGDAPGPHGRSREDMNAA